MKRRIGEEQDNGKCIFTETWVPKPSRGTSKTRWDERPAAGTRRDLKERLDLRFRVVVSATRNQRAHSRLHTTNIVGHRQVQRERNITVISAWFGWKVAKARDAKLRITNCRANAGRQSVSKIVPNLIDLLLHRLRRIDQENNIGTAHFHFRVERKLHGSGIRQELDAGHTGIRQECVGQRPDIFVRIGNFEPCLRAATHDERTSEEDREREPRALPRGIPVDAHGTA